MRRYNHLACRLSGWALCAFFAMIVGLYLFGCSLPFLQVVNPTYTAHIHTPQGFIEVQIPVELPDFVSKETGVIFPVGGNICVVMFSGVTANFEGRIIDRYEFVIECDTHKILALRAIVMDVERFWVYVKDVPVPSSHDQLKEKIEGLIGKKI